MIIKRIEPLSLAKVNGTLYALLGLCVGVLLSLVSMMGGAAGSNMMFGGALGLAAIIVLPLLYGIFGFIFSLIAAALYNVVAGWVGGVQIQAE